jgi:hypothetical protein
MTCELDWCCCVCVTRCCDCLTSSTKSLWSYTYFQIWRATRNSDPLIHALFFNRRSMLRSRIYELLHLLHIVAGTIAGDQRTEIWICVGEGGALNSGKRFRCSAREDVIERNKSGDGLCIFEFSPLSSAPKSDRHCLVGNGSVPVGRIEKDNLV